MSESFFIIRGIIVGIIAIASTITAILNGDEDAFHLVIGLYSLILAYLFGRYDGKRELPIDPPKHIKDNGK